ncbi:MAG: sugar transferase [Myxococcota bacterium]
MSRRQRAFDLAFATAGLALFAVPITTIGVAVRAEDGGPVLFRQERLGLGRRPFTIHKVRTMRDGRVTRVGAWLRATGLDETAQFLDVLRGDMRMVGPRPLTAEDVRRFGYHAASADDRFAVRPGITGLAQVAGGRTIRESRRYDALYARRSSLGLDATLIGLSFLMNLVGKKRARVAWRHGRRLVRRVRRASR